MLLDGNEQVGELAGDVWPNGLVLEQSRNGRQRLLVGRDGEVIGPEVHESLVKGRLGRNCRPVSRSGLPEVMTTHDAPVFLDGIDHLATSLHLALAAPQGLDLDQHTGGVAEAPDLRRRSLRPLQLVQ